MVLALVGTGIFATVRLGFPQLKYLKHGINVTAGKYDNADDKGDCWDPANSDEQTLEVCEKGCYQYFTQSIMQLPGIDDPIVDSKVERLCNSKLN